MTLILLGSRRFTAFWGQDRINAMRHHDTVFQQLTKWIDWAAFDGLVSRHGGDYRVRRLRCRDQFLAMLYAQLSGARSLREVEAGMASQRARLHHAGARPVARASLADANATRPAAIYEALFAAMAGRAGRGLRRHLAPCLRILDATRIALSPGSLGWAHGPQGKASAKLHLVYDPMAAVPLAARITGPRVNDITPARAAEITPGATYVFDLGYYSFEWWAALDAAGCRFVTRLKTHTRLSDPKARAVPEGGAILADRTGRLPPAHGLQTPLREITLTIATGKVLRLVTNDLDSSAEDIADLYKTRWQIELAFKWIKQNLRIRRFLGSSENAVRIQIFTALIAWLILRLAHDAQTAVARPSAFAALVSLNLLHRRPVSALTHPPPPPTNDPRQAQLAWL